MIRVVLDTNVLVAGLKSRNGASFQILRMVGPKAPQPSLSVPLVLEYEMALRRALGAKDQRIEPVLDYLCAVGDLREIFFLWRPFLRDAGDEMVLEVAVGAQASRIVTHNVRDFQGVNERFGILCVFRPKWKGHFGRSGTAVSEEVERAFRGCGTAIPAHVARP